jgi:pyruvate dehydrogenase E2 component (dihydrolipoamide acetyltransferase)
VIGVLTEQKGEAVDAPKAAPRDTSAETPLQPPKETPTPVETPARADDDHGERIFASPLARRMAKQAGIDLATIKGSGPNGRIVKADLDSGKAAPVPAREAAATQAAAPEGARDSARPATQPQAPVMTAPHKKLPNSSMRKIIAKRLTESKQSVPHFYLTSHIEIDALLKLRAELNAKSPKDGPSAFKLSVNDLIIKACAVALRRHPNVNSTYTEQDIIQYDDVDISVAVAIPDGLITPIIRKADQLGLAAISAAMKDLGARAKTGKLKPEEFQGGGFSISNLGMFGIPEFSAIINPPQSAILAVGAGEKRAVVKNDAVTIATMMTVTLSCDHRVVDGALGAEFLSTLKGILEEPLSLML